MYGEFFWSAMCGSGLRRGEENEYGTVDEAMSSGSRDARSRCPHVRAFLAVRRLLGGSDLERRS